ncbi:MAG: hypothetical protein AAF619_09005 [Pseudomonadota bacterium]
MMKLDAAGYSAPSSTQWPVCIALSNSIPTGTFKWHGAHSSEAKAGFS